MSTTNYLLTLFIAICVLMQIVLNAIMQNVLVGPTEATNALSATMVVSAVAYALLGPYPVSAVPVVRLATTMLLSGSACLLGAIYFMVLQMDPPCAYRIGSVIGMFVGGYISRKATR